MTEDKIIMLSVIGEEKIPERTIEQITEQLEKVIEDKDFDIVISNKPIMPIGKEQFKGFLCSMLRFVMRNEEKE